MTVTLHPAFDRTDVERSSADDKYGRIFADHLEDAGVTVAQVLDARLVDAVGKTVALTLSVPDVADWSLRYAVQAVARDFETQWALHAICMYRAAESITA